MATSRSSSRSMRSRIASALDLGCSPLWCKPSRTPATASMPWFRAQSLRAGDFCFGKSHQNHRAGHDDFADVVSAQLPLVLAAASCNGAIVTPTAAIHGLARSKIKQSTSPDHARRRRAPWGPSNTTSGRRTSPKDDRQDAGQFAAGTGCTFGEPRRPRATPEHMDVRRTCSRGGLLFGDFLLATQEKVTRPPGGGWKRTWMSNNKDKVTGPRPAPG
jgi:hypothetical protein